MLLVARIHMSQAPVANTYWLNKEQKQEQEHLEWHCRGCVLIHILVTVRKCCLVVEKITSIRIQGEIQYFWGASITTIGIEWIFFWAHCCYWTQFYRIHFHFVTSISMFIIILPICNVMNIRLSGDMVLVTDVNVWNIIGHTITCAACRLLYGRDWKCLPYATTDCDIFTGT